MSEFIHGELAVVKDNGKHNDYRVNYELVNTKEYHDKFDKLTKYKALNEGLYNRAAKMLENRSGSPYEDIAMLEIHTGEVIVENMSASGVFKHKCGLTPQQTKELEDSGLYFEILHNHPNSSFVSPDDIKGLFKRKKAIGSTVVCHNGAVYRMEKMKQLEDIDEVILNVYKEIKDTHPNWSENMIEALVSEDLISQFIRAKVLRYILRE